MNATVYSTIIVLICCLLSLSMLLNKGNIKKSLIYKCFLFMWVLQGYLTPSCMDWMLNMFCQTSLQRKLLVTLITSILYTFMFRFNMSCQIILLCKLLVTLITSILDTFMYSSQKLDEQSFKKTIQHKTVVFLGHMNDNSNFTFPMTSTIPRRWPLQDYTEATVKENPKFHVFSNFGY